MNVERRASSVELAHEVGLGYTESKGDETRRERTKDGHSDIPSKHKV